MSFSKCLVNNKYTNIKAMQLKSLHKTLQQLIRNSICIDCHF